jgi:hypothetical protein
MKDIIIRILKAHEDSLSGGFGYYCGDVGKELGEIADEIIKEFGRWE